VRETRNVAPEDLSPLQHEDKAWITLLTCEDYDAKANQFMSRLAVRAVLIKVEDE
jgi:sortase (surface protein transpeptidase)